MEIAFSCLSRKTIALRVISFCTSIIVPIKSTSDPHRIRYDGPVWRVSSDLGVRTGNPDHGR